MAGPIVNNVTLVLREGTQLADITYDLDHTDGLSSTVTVEATTDDENWDILQMVTGVGNIGEGVAVGTGKTLLWDIGTEWDTQLLPNLKIRIRADDGQGSAFVLVSRISPSDQTEMVNVTRETVVYFDDPVDPATVTLDSFYLIANGQKIAGRVVVSSTELFATFFYDEPLPSSTEVRIVIDGDMIIGRNGIKIDASDDGVEGGEQFADFRTLPLTRIPGTGIFGYVFDSLSEAPIVGATIRVDAFPEANAMTDTEGRFELTDMPAPEFFVHVDGSTATNTPVGFTYPNVGKPFHSTPGQTVHLNHHGDEFDIYLPPMAIADIQDLSPTETTAVGFGDNGKSTLATLFPEVDPGVWDLMSISFPAGSAQDEFGNPATTAAIIPVPKDRLPAPLPATIDPAFVISIQAAGASNFDVPVPVTFPNLDGLSPGEKSLIFSFNHDAGEWQVIGTGTVSEDGLVIVSDPGVGILAPGWHTAAPGSLGKNGGGSNGRKPPPQDPLKDDKENCKKLQNLAKSKTGQCAFGAASAGLKALPVLGCGVSVAGGLAGYTADCGLDPSQCGASNIALSAATSLLGCIPGIGGASAAALTCLGAAEAVNDAQRCKARLYGTNSDTEVQFDSSVSSNNSIKDLDTQYDEPILHSTRATAVISKGEMAEALLREHAELIQAAGDVFSAIMGSDVWIGVTEADELQYLNMIVEAIDDASGEISDGGEMITQSERDAINAMQIPSHFSVNDVNIAIDRFNAWSNNELTPEEFGIPELLASSEWMEAVFSDAESAGWENINSGAVEATFLLSESDDEEIDSEGFSLIESPIIYNATDLETGFEIRGQLQAGRFDTFVFASNRSYSITYPHSFIKTYL